MAINSSDHVDNSQMQASAITSSKETDLVSNPASVQKPIKSISSATSKKQKANYSGISAYYDGLQLFARRTRKGKNTGALSSIQLASNIYRSNSDEFKLKKKHFKKINRKSVLTLPNHACVKPQAVTVSDINDSEYLYGNKKPKVQKAKKLKQKNKIPPFVNKGFEYYDKESSFCSQMNVYLDCSSTELVKNFKGDGKRKQISNQTGKKDTDLAPHNVWAVLRDINRLRYQPSPPMSEDSQVNLRKNKFSKKKFDNCVYETCRTEQIAYISSINHSGDTPSISGSSSVDRITIIDNVEVVKKIRDPSPDIIEKKIAPQIKSKINRKLIENQQLNNSKRVPRNYSKALPYPNKSTERKVNDTTDVEKTQCSSINKSDANEVLLEPKSKVSIKNRASLNKIDRLEDLSNRTEVEIQTIKNIQDKYKETDKSRINTANAVNAIKSSRRLPPITNRHDRCDTKKSPEHTSLPPRTASNTRPTSNATLTNSLITNEPTNISSNPGNGFKFSMLEDSLRAPLRDTTLTNANQMQRLTLSGIKRALARIKFPLVILGKDELSSGTFKIESYDFPQFNGLDKQIWPFMRDWSDKFNNLHEPDESNMQPARSCYRYTKYNTTNKMPVHLPNNKTNIPREPILTNIKSKENKHIDDNKKNKLECEAVSTVTKLKPIQRFRDRMLKLLYKKPAETSSNVKDTLVQVDIKEEKVANSSNTDIDSKNSLPGRIMNSQTSLLPPMSPSKLLLLQQQPSKSKRNWSKAKYNNDFIENIIKNVTSGVYYAAELKCEFSNKETNLNSTSDGSKLPVNDSKKIPTEVQILTTAEDFMPKITIQKKKKPLVVLPGFDDDLPKLEIKSMTRDQIAVKHCVTNVTLQFDITGTTVESDCIDTRFKRSIVCIPLSVTESKTKVYKCKTRILNAMLPAELCSILPKVMKQCQNNYLGQTLQENNKIFTCLHSIAECTAPPASKLALLAHTKPLTCRYVSSKLRNLMDGRFSKRPTSWSENANLCSKENSYVIILIENSYYHVKDMLPRVIIPDYHDDYITVHVDQPLLMHSTICKHATISTVQDSAPEPINLCRDLVPYVTNEIVHNTHPKVLNSLQMLFLSIMNVMKINSITRYTSRRIQTLNDPIIENQFTNLRSNTDVSISATDIKIDPQVKAHLTKSQMTITNSPKHIERCGRMELMAAKQNPIQNAVSSKVNKNKMRTKYAKLYKKYKSTSRTTTKRSCTPLCNVTNLDEFCKALGTGNMWSSVFDGGCWNKILSCVIELKNWTTDITPSQALMVMLLTNKNETRNLARFRPILLQGIAFNRITRVSELDMEIEVIERERFNLPEFSNISCLIENKQEYNILEELCWIAKTTASDYQKPFDESSEALLKALLNKRKKLNPSYLRVMARYVGLGLLKTPTH